MESIAATHCRICQRRLTRPESIAAGVGPICAGRPKQGDLFMSSCDYSYHWAKACGARVLVILDLNKGGRSVTNDVEAVFEEIGHEEIAAAGGIIYRDSMGQFDGISRGLGGRPGGFYSLARNGKPAFTEDQALATWAFKAGLSS